MRPALRLVTIRPIRDGSVCLLEAKGKEVLVRDL
jgi:hypothetical protein